MSLVGELLARVGFEVASYAIGKATAVLLLPHLGIEPLEKQKGMPPWKWRGFTYQRSARRYLYSETIQLLGAVVLLVLGTGIVAMWRSTIT
jgi:hypothetical protein